MTALFVRWRLFRCRCLFQISGNYDSLASLPQSRRKAARNVEIHHLHFSVWGREFEDVVSAVVLFLEQLSTEFVTGVVTRKEVVLCARTAQERSALKYDRLFNRSTVASSIRNRSFHCGGQLVECA